MAQGLEPGRASPAPGEPSECRYYQNSVLANWGECVYYYCMKDSVGAVDTCCQYFTGALPGGVSIGPSNITYTDGSTVTFAAFTETAGAATTCASKVSYLRANNWHVTWPNDVSVDSSGSRVVTTAYINFDIVRLEFSHQYGLSLYSTSQDTLRVVKSSTAACES